MQVISLTFTILLFLSSSRSYAASQSARSLELSLVNDITWLQLTPKSEEQWHEKASALNLEQAWVELAGRNQSEVIIASIDTGADLNHPDLKDRFWVNEIEANGIPGVDDDNNGYVDDIHGYDFRNKSGAMTDGNGHGTYQAGLIASRHNSVGIRGVMPDHIKIMPLKILNTNAIGNLFDALRAIEYAVNNGADIISISWGFGEKVPANSPKLQSERDQLIKELRESIIAAGKKRVLFVIAAGNHGADNDSVKLYPASYQLSNTLVVGAHDKQGNRLIRSNYGAQSVDVFAPGESIISTTPLNTYQSRSNSSTATALSAGVAGLLYSLAPKSWPSRIKSTMIDNSRKSFSLKGLCKSGGVLDAKEAVLNL